MEKDWVIVCSQSLNHYVHCICGHRVKRITYLYNKNTKAIQYVGKTCVRKHGVEFSLTNPILLEVIKANLHKTEWDRNACVREHIQSQYTTFMTMARESSETQINSVVIPFRRLLSDVCELVSEYGFDLVEVLMDIEREVESLNQATRHQMVDEESLCDTISEIASEYSIDTDFHISDTVAVEECEVLFNEPKEEKESKEEEDETKEEEKEEEPKEEETKEEEKEETKQEETKQEEKEQEPKEEKKEEEDETTSYMCCCTIHCYCEMKYRMRLLQKGIIDLRIKIKNTHDETLELIEKTKEIRISTNKFLDLCNP